MTKQSVRERLTLDHFYIPVTPAELSELSKFPTLARDAVHSRVVSGKDHWEGVYISARTGDYFEIVHYPRASALGLAFSPAKPQYTDARKITKEFSELDWKTGTRLTEKNQPWFDWLSLNEDSAGAVVPPVNAWIMHYHFSHWAQSRMPSGPKVIDRFKRIKLTVGKSQVSAMRALLPWLPGTQNWGSKRALLRLPLRDGHEFEVDIAIKNGNEPLAFRSLEMEVTRGQHLKRAER